MATLRKRGSCYEIDYRINGKRIRKAVGKSKKIAELALKDIEVKIARGELGFERPDSTYQKLLKDFQSYIQTNVAPSTQNRYKAILANFQRFLKARFPHIEKVSHFTPKLFEDFKHYRKEEGAENRTINHELIVLRMMFRLGVQWNYAKDNPTDGVSKLKIPKKNPPRFLTDEECRKLLEACDTWLYPIFFTFLNTGMRKSELENLEWADVDFERRKIKIVFKDDWAPKTDEREIPINSNLYQLLQDLLNDRNGSSYVFPDENGGKIYKNRLRKRLMSLTKRCGFPDVTKIHSLRHTFASHLVMKGVDLASVKQLLGHSEIETTMIYSHLTENHVNQAVDKLNF